MIEIGHKYTCDYCNKSSEENNIVHIRATRQEMYDEGPIDVEGIEFDICKVCGGRYSLAHLIEEINHERSYKNEKES